MKDMPAALLLVLSKRDPALFRKVFDRVVDNGRVLRTLFQMIRSGQFGRKSLSYALAAGVSALAERGQRRPTAVGFDRQRSEPARRSAPGAADAEGQRASRAVRLADRQAGREVGAGLEADLPEEVTLAGCVPQGGVGRASRLLFLDGVRLRWDLLADAARGPASGRRLPGRWVRRRCG